MRRFLFLLFIFITTDVYAFGTGTLHITTQDKKQHSFTIEIASGDEQLAQGLMYRKTLDKNAGMLFLFPEKQMVHMWMKNTFIPLDMLFIREDGVIARIEENATPQSLRSISSGVPVNAVLELNGGISKAWGIKAGDTMTWTIKHP